MTPHPNEPSDEDLAEMLAGLEGVTPGPWAHQRGNKYVAGYAGSVNARQVAVFPEGNLTNKSADFKHIARCDPAIIQYLVTREQERRARGR